MYENVKITHLKFSVGGVVWNGIAQVVRSCYWSAIWEYATNNGASYQPDKYSSC